VVKPVTVEALQGQINGFGTEKENAHVAVSPQQQLQEAWPLAASKLRKGLGVLGVDQLPRPSRSTPGTPEFQAI
jgi:hypothetical protein